MSARSGLGRLAAVAAVAIAALGFGALPASAQLAVTGSLAEGATEGTVDVSVDSVTGGDALIVVSILEAPATCPDPLPTAPTEGYLATTIASGPDSVTIDSEFEVFGVDAAGLTTLPYGDYQFCMYWFIPDEPPQYGGFLAGLEATIGVPEPTTTTSTTAAPTTTTTEAAAAPAAPRYTG